MSDVPLGMFLSGGVDSSAIAALMKGDPAVDHLAYWAIGAGNDAWDNGPLPADNARRTLALPHLTELPDRLEGVRTFDVYKDDSEESRSGI